MDGDKRHLQPIKIGMTSVETGADRFTKDGLLTTPQVSRWRNNLTALSQRYNLYFVALEAEIVVYEPKFPLQTLERQPSLTIQPTIAEPSAEGYIDPRKLHTINHLVVGDLGSEEILLLCTDSGNVAAYHTKAVRDAIRKKPHNYSTDGNADFVGLRPFFNHWVHESAWGLAIHKEARMIAVSANTPYNNECEDEHSKITVFAFALTGHTRGPDDDCQNSTGEASEQQEWKSWAPNRAQSWLSDRSRNYKIVLSGHADNVPCISFVDSRHDREGNWLLSTDIGGRMKLWRVWSRQCWTTWDFSTTVSFVTQHREIVDRGWLVLALDPGAFRAAHTLEEFCGSPRPVHYHRHTETAESFDITNCVRTRTPNTSQLHPAFGAVEDDPDADDQDDPLETDWSDDSESGVTEPGGVHLNENERGDLRVLRDGEDEDEAEIGDSEMDDDEAIGQVDDRQLAEGISVGNADQALYMLSNPDDEQEAETLQSPSEDELDHFDETSPPSSQEYLEDNVDMEDMTPQQQNPTVADRNDFFRPTLDVGNARPLDLPKKRSSESKSYKAIYDAYLATQARKSALTQQPVPVIPAIQCSASHIRLLNVPVAKTPHVFCASALRQTLPRQMELNGFAHIDRMNMMQYIPELGLVVIATQIGRCAVCTLTRKTDTGVLGFRVDFTLPTKQQEKEGLRPNLPLLGVAAGPVQGRQIGEDEDVDSDSSEENGDSEPDHCGRGDVEDHVWDNHDSQGVSSQSEENSDPEDAHATSDTITAQKSPQKDHEMGRAQAPTRRPRRRARHREPWLGIENSRRYRLMLTYYDQTVLTYELSREAPEHASGMDGGTNFRNQSSYY